MGYKVVVAGATGNVGREMLNILAEREFPVDEIAALASRKSLGTEVSFGDKTLKTKDLDTFDFTGWDIALFAIGSDATKKYAPIAAKAARVHFLIAWLLWNIWAARETKQHGSLSGPDMSGLARLMQGRGRIVRTLWAL